jgi:hypothetical protein
MISTHLLSLDGLVQGAPFALRIDLALYPGPSIGRIRFSSLNIHCRLYIREQFAMADVLDIYSKASVLYPRDGGIHPPASVLLDWPNANFIDPETRGWGAPIALLIVVGITFLVYVARIWARLAVAKSLGLDDVLMSIAMVFVFGLTISAVLGMSCTSSPMSLANIL